MLKIIPLMKKIVYLLLFFMYSLGYSQSKYTEAQVEKTTDPQVIANFIKYNPDHPKTPAFKQKLFAIINNDKTPAQASKVAKPTVAPLNTKKLENVVNRDVAKTGEVNAKHKKTAELLNHLFNSDPNGKTAYVSITNKSSCNLIVKISGKQFYNLDVPANNQNYILIDKGNYTITTMVCDAKYSSVKNINKDIVITLNAPK
ncbi:hypothetical protein ACM44_08810 [Chryseobacterium koreense CCUG 49689]|uniref:DUF6759 domain-containing protein n=2 Tax=Chryseobacterium koreense TaxID=232216 RepID=A0A0J7IZ74_9FLAO|nr:hypothetical protein ACM44_08810 [Chryseobacterium koreense CCUG 49689]